MVTLTPIDAIPEVVDDEFVASFRRSLHEYTHANPVHLRKYLPKDFVLDILRRTQAIVAKEATLVEVRWWGFIHLVDLCFLHYRGMYDVVDHS